MIVRPPGLATLRNKLPFRGNGPSDGNGAPARDNGQTVAENGKALQGNGRARGAAKLLPVGAWRMPSFSPKAFSERNPYIIGTIALAIILVFTAGALFLQGGTLFTSTFQTSAAFPDTSGIASGDQVVMAGIKVGKVGSAKLDGNQVRVALSINSGTQVPADSTAEIKIQSFLGTEAVNLIPGTDWSHLLHQGSVIAKTKVPFNLNQLANTAVPALNQTNSAQINELLADLQAVTQGQRGNVTTIINNLNGLTTTVNQRQAEVSVLLDSANTLVGTLNGRSEQLASILYNLNVVVQGLAQRKTALAQLISSTDQAASQLSGLVGANRTKLQAILNEVHTDLQIIDSRQVDLTQGLGYAANAVNGFSSIGYVGPNNNIVTPYVSSSTGFRGSAEATMFEPCGTLNQIFDQALPPDPAQHGPGRSCASQPAIEPNQFAHDFGQSSGSSSGPSAPPSASGGAPVQPSGGGASALPGSVSGGQSIASLFAPQLGGRP
ncbi:MAG TPA: MlaD family protein [Acidimicrobiales bacterium]|nr:MlaD family protein [Acidimicrobiales bacterium]